MARPARLSSRLVFLSVLLAFARGHVEHFGHAQAGNYLSVEEASADSAQQRRLHQPRLSVRGEEASSDSRRSLLVHGTQASKACSLVIKSEQHLSSSDRATSTLSELVVEGRWAYQRTNEGVLKNSKLNSDSGPFDLWVEKSVSSEWDGGNIQEVSTLIYVTSQTETTEGYVDSVTVRAEGWYDGDSGLLCLLGCEEGNNKELWGTAAGKEESATNSLPLHEEEAAFSKQFGVAEVMDSSGSVDRLVCDMRLLLRFKSKQEGSSKQSQVTGQLESLRQPGESSFFSPIVVTGNTGEMSSQVMWFHLEMIFEAVVYALQAACIGVQIMHTRKDPEAVHVSLTMLCVQIFVYAFYWVRSLYYPLRYLNSDILIYFLSDVANIPRFAEFAIFVLYIALAVMVDTRRRKVSRQKIGTVRKEGRDTADNEAADIEAAGLLSSGRGEGALQGSLSSRPGISERQFALCFWPVYAVLGLIMWFTYNFDAFLKWSTFLFLLPQVLANYFCDPAESSLKAVHAGYAVGNTLFQMIWSTYEVVRPRLMGYDSVFAFPHAWFWSSMVLMMAQLGLFFVQSFRGGRFNKPSLGTTFLKNNAPDESKRTETTVSQKAPANTFMGTVL